MVDIVDNAYFKEGEVQLMLPVSNDCTFVGPSGIKFHSSYGDVLINDYIHHPKRELFPFHDTPIHKDKRATFVNQLFQLNRQYLAVYSSGGRHRFRADTFFQEDGVIYVSTDVEIDMKSTEAKEMSEEELKERFQSVLSQNVFFCIIDDDGELHEYSKDAIDVEIPLSGIALFGDGTELKAHTYRLKAKRGQISIQNQELNLHGNDIGPEDLGDCSHVPEPNIRRI